MKKVYLFAGVAVTCLSTFYFVRAANQNWTSIQAVELDAWLVVSMTGASLLYAATYLISSKAWQLELRYLGERLKWRTSLEIISVSQFAKYLPGNVGHHVGRIILGKRMGLSPQVVVGSLFIDTVMVILAALACSLPSYPILFLLAGHRIPNMGSSLVGATVVIGLTCLLGWTLRKKVIGYIRNSQVATSLMNARGAHLLFRSVASYCVNFLLGGLALYLLLDMEMAATDLRGAIQVMGVYSAAWLLGFLIPGAPAGIGIREASLLVGVGPLAGHENALIAAALLRVVTTLVDGSVFILGLMLSRCGADSVSRTGIH